MMSRLQQAQRHLPLHQGPLIYGDGLRVQNLWRVAITKSLPRDSKQRVVLRPGPSSRQPQPDRMTGLSRTIDLPKGRLITAIPPFRRPDGGSAARNP